MLYQIDHSFSSTHNLHFLSHLPTALLSSQVEFEMECVQGPLKGSLGKEIGLFEDLLNVNGQNGVGSVEDFSVDDLLDFSVMGCDENDETEVLKIESLNTEQVVEEKQSFCNYGFKDDFGSNELAVPVDEVANLEWLSHFVEDSFSEYSVPFPAGVLRENLKKSPEKFIKVPVPVIPCFPTPVPAKARTKRNRTGGRGGWLSGSTTESSASSSSSSSSNSSPITPPWFIYTTANRFIDSVNAPVHKPKRRIVSETGGPPRRCSHCGVQKTPQWRTGPLGAKTLCNACGVRFKSGRLLPEYRPACSPSFSSEVHSNHHRKVLEMRKKKEPGSSESGLAPAVVSF